MHLQALSCDFYRVTFNCIAKVTCKKRTALNTAGINILLIHALIVVNTEIFTKGS